MFIYGANGNTVMVNSVIKIILVCLISIFGMQFSVWAQVPDEAEDNPFRISVSYTGDLFSNVAGGNKTGIRYLDNIDVNLEVNFEELPLGLGGTTLNVYGLGNQGGSISALAGDLQGISNIEAENSWRLYEFWMQKKFFLANSSLLVGLYDINSEFNALNSSQLFLNSSHGIDPTIAFSGRLGPSIFPYTSLGGRFKINPYKGLVLQAAILDGVPSDPGNTSGTKIYLREDDGVLLIGELGIHSVSSQNLQLRNKISRLQNMLAPRVQSDNKVAIGGWYYTEERAGWDSPNTSGNEYGMYALGEYEIFTNNGESLQGIRAFARAGLANADINILGGFWAAGFVLEGLLPNRQNDQTGIAVAYASASSPYINNTFVSGSRPEQAETNIELTHLFKLNGYVQLQGNIQYVLNPGLNASLENALVVGIRSIVGF